jgi:hypothetical protein
MNVFTIEKAIDRTIDEIQGRLYAHKDYKHSIINCVNQLDKDRQEIIESVMENISLRTNYDLKQKKFDNKMIIYFSLILLGLILLTLLIKWLGEL